MWSSPTARRARSGSDHVLKDVVQLLGAKPLQRGLDSTVVAPIVRLDPRLRLPAVFPDEAASMAREIAGALLHVSSVAPLAFIKHGACGD
jgi:hypothetical protein